MKIALIKISKAGHCVFQGPPSYAGIRKLLRSFKFKKAEVLNVSRISAQRKNTKLPVDVSLLKNVYLRGRGQEDI